SVLDAVKARPGSVGASGTGGLPAGLDRVCARRLVKMRSGRRNACGAVEQRNEDEQATRALRPRNDVRSAGSFLPWVGWANSPAAALLGGHGAIANLPTMRRRDRAPLPTLRGGGIRWGS